MEEEENSGTAMSEISKKRCKASLKTCHCCNSTLQKIFDSIDLFRKTAKKENLVKKLKDIGKIEVQEEDVNILPTKVCRKCFRKIARLAKDVHAFRDICLKSKQIQEIHINARQKRGRNLYPPAQHNPEKKIRQCDSSEFTVRHFNNTPADTENTRSVGLRVRTSLFASEEQTPQREILPFPAFEKATTTSTREKPQASEILKDASLQNPEVCVIMALPVSFTPFTVVQPANIFLIFERKVMNK